MVIVVRHFIYLVQLKILTNHSKVVETLNKVKIFKLYKLT